LPSPTESQVIVPCLSQEKIDNHLPTLIRVIITYGKITSEKICEEIKEKSLSLFQKLNFQTKFLRTLVIASSTTYFTLVETKL
jgi:hypothetical protein